MPRLAFEAVPRAIDANGTPISFAKLRVYLAGTTTPVTTYSDRSMASPQSIPVLADSAGVFPQIYVPDGAYKVRISTADNATLQEADWVVTDDGGSAFGTVAAMKAANTLRAGDLVSTLGYNVAGDLGAAQYRIVEDLDFPGSPDGVIDHAITGTTLVAQFVHNGEVRPQQFGADDTGATSATTAINAAAAYLSTGGTILMTGEFLIGSSVRIENDGVKMIGRGSATLRRGGLAFTLVQLDTDDYQGVNDCEVSGLIVEGQGATYASGASITVRGSRNVISYNVIEDSAGHGIALSGTLTGTYVASGTTATITLTNDYSLTVGQSVDLQFQGTVPDATYTVATVVSSKIFTVTLGASYSESGLAANLRSGQTAHNKVIGNWITSAGNIGISQHTATDSLILGNYVADAFAEGITVDNASVRSRVIGNHLLNNCSTGGCGGIGIDASALSIISDNVIEMTGSTGTLKPCICFNNLAGNTSRVVVSGNTLIGSPKAAVWLKHTVGAAVGAAGYFSANQNAITGNTVQACAAGVLIDTTCDYNEVSVLTGDTAASRTVTDLGAHNRVPGKTDHWVLRHSAAITNVTGDGTQYVIPFNTVHKEIGDMSIASGVVTVENPGVYHLTAGLKVEPGAGTTFATLSILRNGSEVVVAAEENWATVPTAPDLGCGISIELDAGDTVSARLRVGGAGSLNSGLASMLQANYFAGVRVA